MTTQPTQPPFGDKSPQGQLAPQAAPARLSRRKPPPRVTHALAARHEALWLKLNALQVQVASAAGKRPQARVAAHTAMVAEALLRDCRPFLEAGDRLPMAAPDCGGLATQLGQALADMQLWEAANTAWRADLNAFVWTVPGDTPLPVQRLRPKLKTPVAPVADPKRAAYMLDLRAKLAKRIDQFNRR